MQEQQKVEEGKELRFLTKEEGEECLNRYYDRVKTEYGNHKFLKGGLQQNPCRFTSDIDFLQSFRPSYKPKEHAFSLAANFYGSILMNEVMQEVAGVRFPTLDELKGLSEEERSEHRYAASSPNVGLVINSRWNQLMMIMQGDKEVMGANERAINRKASSLVEFAFNVFAFHLIPKEERKNLKDIYWAGIDKRAGVQYIPLENISLIQEKSRRRVVLGLKSIEGVVQNNDFVKIIEKAYRENARNKKSGKADKYDMYDVREGKIHLKHASEQIMPVQISAINLETTLEDNALSNCFGTFVFGGFSTDKKRD